MDHMDFGFADLAFRFAVLCFFVVGTLAAFVQG